MIQTNSQKRSIKLQNVEIGNIVFIIGNFFIAIHSQTTRSKFADQ